VTACVDTELNADLLVADVMQRWPSTVTVFMSHRMACPGCPMAPFVTIGEAAAAYGIAAETLLSAFQPAVCGRRDPDPF
jgi:hybrid cluster-associated redox disulfide protein